MKHVAPILVVGESGDGKSTMMATLDPDRTIILNTEEKPLPFRNASDFKVSGISTYKKMEAALTFCEKDEGEKFDTIVLDSFTSLAEIVDTYVSNVYRGYDIWKNYNLILADMMKRLKRLKQQVIVIGIPEQKDMEFGEVKKYLRVKGKELKYGFIEKEFAIVLFTKPIYDEDGEVEDVEMIFKPNRNNSAKAPVGMFTKRPKNDAKEIIDAVQKYYERNEEKG